MYQSGGNWYRTIAVVGDGITSATYVPYLSYQEVVYYDGIKTEDINTFALREDSNGIWNVRGSYDAIRVNLEDKDGNLLTIGTKNIVGRNCRIFDNLEDMKAWLAE